MSDEQQDLGSQSESPKPLRARRRQGQKMTPDERKQLQEKFLESFRVYANLSAACDDVGIHIDTPYDWKNRYPDFAKQFEEAEQRSNDGIDMEIYRRGVKGWLEPAVSAGKWVQDDDGNHVMIPRYSDAMLTLLAKSRMSKYREKQQIEMSGPNGAPIQQQTFTVDPRSMTPEQLATLKKLAQEMKEGQPS